MVADPTGSIYFNAYDDIGEALKPGDIIYTKNAYLSLYKNMNILY